MYVVSMYRNCSQSSIGIINFHFLSNFVWLTFGSLVPLGALFIYICCLFSALFVCLLAWFTSLMVIYIICLCLFVYFFDICCFVLCVQSVNSALISILMQSIQLFQHYSAYS